MTAFSFNTVAQIICECHGTMRLGEIITQQYSIRSVMLVSDPGIQSAGILDIAIKGLKKAGLDVCVYCNVTPDPSEDIVNKALEMAKAETIELVIGLGGGSSMDVAKLIAVLHQSSQSLNDIYGLDQVKGKRETPLILIPTTAGTGSEVTPISIITTGETSKMGIVSPQLYADITILDAALTLGLPANITAYTGLDAMVHAIEAYTSKHKKNILSDGLAKQALELLAGNLLTVLSDGSNLQAREAMLIGSMLAGQAFANAPVAAVHALAYPLGGIFHIPHGLSNAVVLPHVLRFNASHAEKEYAELAPFFLADCQGDHKEKATQFINAIDAMIQATKIPSTLQELGIKASDVPRLAEEAMLQTRLLVNNPRSVTLADAREIYTAAL